MLQDFDFASIPGVVENQKVNASFTEGVNTEGVNINKEQNRYYDIHYFFIILINFFPKLEETAPVELRLFIEKVIPTPFR